MAADLRQPGVDPGTRARVHALTGGERGTVCGFPRPLALVIGTGEIGSDREPLVVSTFQLTDGREGV